MSFVCILHRKDKLLYIFRFHTLPIGLSVGNARRRVFVSFLHENKQVNYILERERNALLAVPRTHKLKCKVWIQCHWNQTIYIQYLCILFYSLKFKVFLWWTTMTSFLISANQIFNNNINCVAVGCFSWKYIMIWDF